MCVYIYIHTMYIFTRIASYRYALKGAGDESDREYSSTGEVKEDADAAMRPPSLESQKSGENTCPLGFLGERLCDNRELLWN